MSKRVQKRKQTTANNQVKAVKSAIRKLKKQVDFDKFLKLIDYGMRFYGYCQIPHFIDVCSSHAVVLHLIFNWPLIVRLLFLAQQYCITVLPNLKGVL